MNLQLIACLLFVAATILGLHETHRLLPQKDKRPALFAGAFTVYSVAMAVGISLMDANS